MWFLLSWGASEARQDAWLWETGFDEQGEYVVSPDPEGVNALQARRREERFELLALASLVGLPVVGAALLYVNRGTRSSRACG